MSDELKVQCFTYEIEISNDMIWLGQFNTIGDEKIGDVIFRLENDLCKVKTKTEKEMLILKGMRKMVQYLKDHYEDQMHLDIMDLQKTLDKMKNENMSSASTLQHNSLKDHINDN